jgi:hypothetical protein
MRNLLSYCVKGVLNKLANPVEVRTVERLSRQQFKELQRVWAKRTVDILVCPLTGANVAMNEWQEVPPVRQVSR